MNEKYKKREAFLEALTKLENKFGIYLFADDNGNLWIQESPDDYDTKYIAKGHFEDSTSIGVE